MGSISGQHLTNAQSQSLKKCNKSIFSTYRVSFNDGFEISASLIRSVGEEVWAGLVPVASAAIEEAVSGNGGGDMAAAAAAH